jgi:hypothetical protein
LERKRFALHLLIEGGSAPRGRMKTAHQAIYLYSSLSGNLKQAARLSSNRNIRNFAKPSQSGTGLAPDRTSSS